MTLAQALALVQQQKEKSQRRRIFLACGFQPLHLETFLKAHLGLRFPEQSAAIETGLYGNLEETLPVAAESQSEAAAAVIEWADIDPRLGLRSAGGWALSVQADILDSCRNRFARLLAGLETLTARMPVALVPPTLSSTLMGHTSGWQSSTNELELQKEAAIFFADAARIPGVAVMNSSALSRISPEPTRLDSSMELKAGFPYTIEHASAVASEIVKLLFPPEPMKGLITDLDDTLWSGIVGEVGASAVSWSLAEQSQIHGLYQQMLFHLSEMGVLLAVVSKNEPTVVEAALQREDLLVPARCFFPVSANWGPKSHSIAEVLRIWNIGADSVVFVDDTRMELDEVGAVFPSMTRLQFSKKPGEMLKMFEKLRDLFGKPEILREDGLRQASIRGNAVVQSLAGTASREFVRSLQGKLTFETCKDSWNKRLLGLINKTNQFNLNGVRISEGEWMRQLADPAAIVVSVAYEDKFGPLGVIGVVAGRHVGRELEVSTWVMSCRAFSRRIEFHTLQHLFESCEVESISLYSRPTDRNEPILHFLRTLNAATDGTGHRIVSKASFLQADYELPHRVEVREQALQKE